VTEPLDNVQRQRIVRALADRDLPCERCGFNLRGLPSPICPECGAEVRTEYVLDGRFADELAALRRRAEWQVRIAFALPTVRLLATLVVFTAWKDSEVGPLAVCPGLLLLDLVALAMCSRSVVAAANATPRTREELLNVDASVANGRAALLFVWVAHAAGVLTFWLLS
jgi:hypothetical protein